MNSLNFHISARQKYDVPIDKFITKEFFNLNVESIKTVFGFVEFTPMYGGRPYIKPEILTSDIEWMYANNIGLNLPLSNMHTTSSEYEASKSFLDKYHRLGNVVTLYCDEIAELIRKDFPLYSIVASAIKNIKTNEQIEEALNIYDHIVLRTWANTDLEFLKSIIPKNRIILFSNIGKAHNCHSKMCYHDISLYNSAWNQHSSLWDLEDGIRCSRTMKGEIISTAPDFQQFNIEDFQQMGFSIFKVLRQWNQKRAY